MAKILILIAGHLCTNPRPLKEAESLANAGYNVLIKGMWFDPALAQRDIILTNGKKWNFEPIIDFRPDGVRKRIKNFIVRLETKCALELYKKAGIYTPYSLGYGIRSMLSSALREKADLTIVRSEAGLWVGKKLIDYGYNVGVDFEDWYSENYLPTPNIPKLIKKTKNLEKFLAEKCKYCLVPSNSMAEKISKTYEVPFPHVVYNVFPKSEQIKVDNKIIDRIDKKKPSVHWFSQTIGHGRGIEILMAALSHIEPSFEIHIRGESSDYIRRWLKEIAPKYWREHIYFHKTVSNEELLSRITEHDIGLALESDLVANKDLTVSNKLFQYMQAGLAIIATKTTGQKEIFEKFPGIGILIDQGNSKNLANALERFINSPMHLAMAKKNSLEAHNVRYSWEKEEGVILDLVEELIIDE